MTAQRQLRNIAIIAHVDHGKTTLVDKLLVQAGTFAAHQHIAERGVAVVHRTRFTLYVQDPEGNRVGLSHHPHEE